MRAAWTWLTLVMTPWMRCCGGRERTGRTASAAPSISPRRTRAMARFADGQPHARRSRGGVLGALLRVANRLVVATARVGDERLVPRPDQEEPTREKFRDSSAPSNCNALQASLSLHSASLNGIQTLGLRWTRPFMGYEIGQRIRNSQASLSSRMAGISCTLWSAVLRDRGTFPIEPSVSVCATS